MHRSQFPAIDEMVDIMHSKTIESTFVMSKLQGKMGIYSQDLFLASSP